MRIIEGSVYELLCESCHATVPHFVFSGDTDMATEGLLSAGSNVTKDVAIFEASSDEFLKTGYDLDKAAARLPKLFGRNDLHLVRYLMSENEFVPKSGTFRNFRERYKPPVPVYACPCCVNGQMRPTGIFEPAEFIKAGGRILFSENLTLR